MLKETYMKAAFKMVIIMVSVIANEKLRKVRIVVGAELAHSYLFTGQRALYLKKCDSFNFKSIQY